MEASVIQLHSDRLVLGSLILPEHIIVPHRKQNQLSMADDSSARFILDAIACGGELKMDFKPVATHHGISLAGNAYVNPYRSFVEEGANEFIEVASFKSN